MADDSSQKPRRWRPLRVLFWLVLGGFLLLTLVNILGPDLDVSGEDRIALIRVEGVILDAQQTVGDLKKYGESPSVKAIVLRIDSPGGGVVPSQEIYSEVLKARTEGKVKVVTSMGNLAASGGYYIAAATDRIVASPGTLTGSIGVIMELANVQGLMEKVGVQSVVIKSGKHKDLASPFRTMSVEDRAILQTVLDDVHDQFIQAVAAGRAMKVDEVRALADGRVFTGRQARTAKLVDELGDLQDAIKLAGKMGGIAGEPRVVETRKRFSLRDVLGNFFDGKISPLIPSGINLKYLLAF